MTDVVAQIAQNGGSIVTVAPPLVSDYFISVTKQAGGILVFDGYAPDDATRTRFSEIENADVNFLQLGRGAPPNFQAAVDFSLEILSRLSEGRVVLGGIALSVSGIATTSEDDAAIRALLDNLPTGVQLATIEYQSPQPAEAETPVAPETAAVLPSVSPYTWSAERLADGSFLFTGHVPAQSLKDYIEVRAATRVTDTSQIAAGAPEGFAADVRLAVDALLLLDEGVALFDGTAWSIDGTAAAADSGTQIAALLGARDWDVALSQPAAPVPETPAVAAVEATTPVAPEPEPAQPSEPQVEVQQTAPTPSVGSPADLALCQDQLAELSAHNAILFQSGAAIIAASAASELDAFAAALALCPDHSVFVEGHTDSDGDAQKNLALSVARAEAVVDAMIGRGVAAERLYAVGYGESQPVADNATADGKRQNRRIVVAVRDAEN